MTPTPGSSRPSRIGRYDVVRLLGQGGMGRVLLARDSVLGRFVAVKILRDDLGLPPESREALFARMGQEARAAAAIDHPHIVTLHDMGEEAPVGLYLVFEYVSGPTLRERITEGALDVVVVAQMARQLGDALTTAHEAGVIHRDVKPENVILAKHGAKLTDFGIARLGDSTLTTAGSVLGTPAYSAPEALAQGEFSPRTDQFSLACLLYEALSARRAYVADDALGIATKIATEPPPPLPFTAADPRLLARLDAVLGRAMAREPEKRYPTCRAFGDALAVAIEARVIDTPRYETLPPPKSIIPRATRRVHNLIAAVALLTILGLVVFGRARGEGVSLREVADSFTSAASAASAAHAVPAVSLPPPRPKKSAPPSPSREPSHENDAGERALHPDDAGASLAPPQPSPAPPTSPPDAGAASPPGEGTRDARLPSPPSGEARAHE